MPITTIEAEALIVKVNKKDAEDISKLKERWKNEDDRKTLIKTAINHKFHTFLKWIQETLPLSAEDQALLSYISPIGELKYVEAISLIRKFNKTNFKATDDKTIETISELQKRWEDENDRKMLITSATSVNSSPFFRYLHEIGLHIPKCDHNLFKEKAIFPALARALGEVGVTVEPLTFIGLPDNPLHIITISGSEKISYRNGGFFRHIIGQDPKEILSMSALGPDHFFRIATLIRNHGNEEQKEQYRESLKTRELPSGKTTRLFALGALEHYNIEMPESWKNQIQTPSARAAEPGVDILNTETEIIPSPDTDCSRTIRGGEKIIYKDSAFLFQKQNKEPEAISIPDLPQNAFFSIATLVLDHGSEEHKTQYRESLKTRPLPSVKRMISLALGAVRNYGIDMPESWKSKIQPKLSLTHIAHFIIESALSEILRLNSASAKAESYSPTGVFESVLRDVFVRNYAIQELISIVSYVVSKQKPQRDEDRMKQYLFEHSGIGYALFEVAWEKYRDDEPDQSLLQSLKKIYAQARSEGEIDASTSDVEMDTATTNPDTEPSEPDVDILGDTDTKRQAETEAISSDAAPRVKSPRPTSKRKPSEWTAAVVLLNIRTGETRPASSSSALPEPDTAPSEPVESSTYTDAEATLGLLQLSKKISAEARFEGEPDVDILGDADDTVRGEKRPASRRNDDEISDTETERSSDTVRGIRRRTGGFVESTGTCEPINVLGGRAR